MSRSIKKDQNCWCTETEYLSLNDPHYSGIEMVLFPRSKMIRTRVYWTQDIEHGIFDTQDVVNVKYCPLCGREL
jgi:hypothetical protein